jgi:uncharacterized cofD-like protein
MSTITTHQHTLPRRVVVMGGGTGIYPVIAALGSVSNIEITTVVSVSDSGGSTGRIRDEFGFPPVGDLRQSLAALAQDESAEWIRKVLLYRFEKGEGLKGHNLGNLILTALQDMTGDTQRALDVAHAIFRIAGHVVPVTKENVQLLIHYQNGQRVLGEHTLDVNIPTPTPIDHIELTPPARLHPVADQAIRNAELILIGPGDYYASLMATLVPAGVPAAFAATKAQVVYILNLMTRVTQTHGMTANAHVKGIEHAIGRAVDKVVVNTGGIASSMLQYYETSREYPVVDDLPQEQHIVRADVVSEVPATIGHIDTAHRSLLRHDSEKLRPVLLEFLQQ